MLLQLALAVFGLASAWMATGHSARSRKWAPVVGLVGQPFWMAYAEGAGAWGLIVVSLAFTAVYARGVWLQWWVAP